jgi:hypothetical protein
MTAAAAEGYAATLPLLAIGSDVSASWPETKLTALGLLLRMPPSFHVQEDAEMQAIGIWTFRSEGAEEELYLQGIENRDGTANFMLITEGAQTSIEGQYALPIASRLSAVTLMREELPGKTTFYVATATVVLSDERCLGLGIVTHSATRRSELLKAWHSLRTTSSA